MREVAFLKQNKDKWESFEKMLRPGSQPDPNQLTEYFIELTDDLSYAQTYYPDSKSTKYLNSLAAKVHQGIYKNKREQGSRLRRFWMQEVPLAIRKTHKEILIAFIVFILSGLIGVVSMIEEPRFAAVILGQGYINMTEENIRKGDPMAVYKREGQMDMFSSIALNNVRVALRMYAGGITAGLLTIQGLVQNGIMVGTFQYFFQTRGVLWQSVLVIWIHGTIEIACIILAGGAGLALARGIVFPKTYPRLVSIAMAARTSLKVMIGLVPLIISAAILESFVTRYTQIPEAASLGIILSSLSFVVWYFIIYPLQCERRLEYGTAA